MILIATWLSWVTYTPVYSRFALVTRALLSPGYTGMWLVIPSMIADVVDDEELLSGDRREVALIPSSTRWERPAPD